MILKNYKKRQIYIQYLYRIFYKNIYKYRLVLKLIIKNKFIECQQKILAIFYIIEYNKINFKSYHKNICLLNGSKRSVNKFFKLNRMSILDNLNNLIYPGLHKAIW